jgi:hypothetical protein
MRMIQARNRKIQDIQRGTKVGKVTRSQFWGINIMGAENNLANVDVGVNMVLFGEG